MDHEEMRNAYLRALDFTKTDFLDFCNDCKTDSDESTGKIIHFETVSKDSLKTVYSLWYCQSCYDKFSHQNENFLFS